MPPASQLRGDLAACLTFYTRLPVTGPDPAENDFAAAQWAAPLAGLAVALCGAAAFAIAALLALPAMLCGVIAVAATMLASGALHEDGLCDVADGFGGGATRERKLEIMRDSRVGSYGVAALVFSILLRAGALATIAAPGAALAALVAAHAAARAPMPSFMRLLPPARSDGLSAGVGTVPPRRATAALLLGGLALLPLGIAAAFGVAILLLAWTLLLKRLAQRQIGGQTGDVLGALEQGGEILVLLVAASHLQP